MPSPPLLLLPILQDTYYDDNMLLSFEILTLSGVAFQITRNFISPSFYESHLCNNNA